MSLVQLQDICQERGECEGVEGTLERLLADAAFAEAEWEVEEDPDILNDPIMELNLKV